MVRGQTTANAEVSQLEQLKRTVADARTLIEFAVASSRKIEDKIIQELMLAIAGLGDLTAQTAVGLDKEAEFWKAYQHLVLAVVPVSANSIRESKAASAGWFRTTTLHSVATFFVFLLLVLLQVVWVIGTTLRKDLAVSDKAIAAKESERRPLDIRLSEILLREDRIFSSASAERKPSPEELKQLQQIADERRKVEPELQDVNQALARLRSEREPLVALVTEWYNTFTFGKWPVSGDSRVRSLQDERKRLQDEIAQGKGSVFIISRLRSDLRQIDQYRIPAARDQIVTELKYRVDLILEGMQKYVFPLVLGLLGALTYILRNLHTQMREYYYTHNTSKLSFVRTVLGMIAGLLGGMLIPSSDDILKAIPPIVLPFFFGYAVEVVFAFLDRIVKAFVEEQPRKG